MSPHYAFDSRASLSAREASTKLDWMLDFLDSLGPGVHYLCTHPGEPCSELRSPALSGTAASAWAEDYRGSDLDTLCDPRVQERVLEWTNLAGNAKHADAMGRLRDELVARLMATRIPEDDRPDQLL